MPRIPICSDNSFLLHFILVKFYFETKKNGHIMVLQISRVEVQVSRHGSAQLAAANLLAEATEIGVSDLQATPNQVDVS